MAAPPATGAAEVGLAVDELHVSYGAMEVVHGVSLHLKPGELVSMVGRNGAGKTTTMETVAGLRPGRTSGRVRLAGREVLGQGAPTISRLGLALVPAGHRVFPALSVKENVRLGAFPVRRSLGRGELDRRQAGVHDLFPVLSTYAERQASQLSGGEQQMLAIAQTLMAEPRLLILDEPTSGLAPPVVRTIFEALERLRQRGLGILIVEQNVERALEHSDRCYVLDGGRVAMEGPSVELRRDPRVEAIVAGIA